MRQLYTLLLYLALPLAFLRLLWRSSRAPAYRQRWGERLGLFPPLRVTRSLWIHAVSVGEVQAARPLVNRLLSEHPEWPLVLTTTTPTGSDLVQQLFGSSLYHVYFPYDIPFAITGFIRRARPRLLLMVETEIWPNLLAECEQRKIPTLLANARLSQRSAAGYARLGGFTRKTFARIGLVAAQAEADAARFQSLGVEAARVIVTGSIKFDLDLPASLHEQAAVLRRQWANRLVWVGASTHEGEDEQLLAAHALILQVHPNALLVLVPRHPERFDRVATLCRKKGFTIARRSEAGHSGTDTAVFLGDTMGELTLFMAAADTAFVGGSLVPIGGHNVLEPAAVGVPILFGPHMFNFAGICRMLLDAGGAEQVADAAALAGIVNRWFGDASERARVGENGRQLVARNRGALDRLYRLVVDRL